MPQRTALGAVGRAFLVGLDPPHAPWVDAVRDAHDSFVPARVEAHFLPCGREKNRPAARISLELCQLAFSLHHCCVLPSGTPMLSCINRSNGVALCLKGVVRDGIIGGGVGSSGGEAAAGAAAPSPSENDFQRTNQASKSSPPGALTNAPPQPGVPRRGSWGSSSFTPQRRFTPYTPHTPPLLPYPVYPVYPRGEDIPRIPPCSGYTPYTLLFWIYPVYPVYPIYPIYPVYPACADLPRFTPISDPLAALSDIFSPNNCAKPIARIERASRSRSAATPS